MRLLDLPYLPLFQILRFLDGKSLVKMQLSSRALNCFIDRNRRRLAFRPIGRIQQMDILRTLACDIPFYFVETTESDDVFSCYGASDDKSGPFDSTFNEWINQFSYVEIEELLIREPHLEEKQMDRFQYLLSIKKLRAESLCILIERCVLPYDDISCLTNLVAQIKPKNFLLWAKESNIPIHLLKKAFLEMMPSLDGLEFSYHNVCLNTLYKDMELTAFPILTEKVPSVFRISCAFYLNFQHFKRLIHGWYNDGEITIDDWVVSLIGFGENVEMGEKLGLPFSIGHYETIMITRPFEGANQDIWIRKTRRDNVKSGADEWAIFGNPPEPL